MFSSWWQRIAVAACALFIAGMLVCSAGAETGKKAPAKHSSSKAKSHASNTHRVKAQKNSKTRKGKKSRKTARNWRRGQQKIDSQRARAIQEALIREHYLEGEPSGQWDAATQTAMQHYQADNGWQSKTTPDARALIKLGLGPDHEHLLNPDSAMTGLPKPVTLPNSPANQTPLTSPQVPDPSNIPQQPY